MNSTDTAKNFLVQQYKLSDMQMVLEAIEEVQDNSKFTAEQKCELTSWLIASHWKMVNES